MSLIGDSLLNEIVHDREIHEPDKILEEMHRGVQRNLNQYQTQNRDGMDAAICVINKHNHTLEFAGAGNPLYYVQNKEFKIIKGNIASIGGLQRAAEIVFTKHIVDISQKTTFYIFSDGYQDQFGSETRRKFTPRRFRDLLFSINDELMEQQNMILKSNIESWMEDGNENQIDDMLVVGFRV